MLLTGEGGDVTLKAKEEEPLKQSRIALVVGCLLLACGGAQAAVYSLNFGAVSPSGIWNGSDQNWGTTLGNVQYAPIPSVLTITAKSGLGATDDPLFVSGKTGTIFWGNLGNLDAGIDCDPMGGIAAGCVGLGVQSASGGGSKGISGEGGDADEALVFTFANPPGVISQSVQLTLIGLNSSGMNTDQVDLYFEFLPVDPNSDATIVNYSFSASNGVAVVDFSTLSGVPNNTFGAFAVRATTGHFGVGGISFAEVPEPAFLGLLGAGLAGLYAARRWRSRKNQAA